MKHRAFSPLAAAAAAGMAILLAGGTATGAMAAVTSTSAPAAQQGTPTAPGTPTGLTATPSNGTATLSWSPPKGGLKAGDGYLIYMGTSSGHEGAKPSVPYLIENVTSYTIAPLKDGTRYYFQVALLAANNQVSARSAEVSAVPGVAASSAARPSASAGATARSGVNAPAQPSTSPLRDAKATQHRTPSGLSTGLVVLLAALVLAAAAGGATTVMLLRRRRYDRRYGPVPAPRHPHDDQPTGQSSRTEEMNGPRYR
jgi:Fibronectin type III domain